MPILWNDTIIENDELKKAIDMYMPAGKNKMVTFARLNAQPFQAIGLGKTLKKMGGEFQLPCFDATVIEGKGEGVMRYYETVSSVPMKGGGLSKEHSPNFITFRSHNIMFDASKKPALFYFLLHHSQNVKNEGRTGAVPEFQLLNPAKAAKDRVSKVLLVAQAIAKVDELKNNNKKQLRAFYEIITGNDDWDEKNKTHELDICYAAIYEHCQKDPQDALDKMDDAALDIVSKVMEAYNKKIIVIQGKAIYWNEGVKENIKKRKITEIPRGKESNWQDWFATNFLRSESNVAQELDNELKNYSEPNS